METAIAVALVSIVGLIAIRTLYRMIKGKDDYSNCGCGCPACTVESCPSRDAPAAESNPASSDDPNASTAVPPGGHTPS